jgi:uncharacterized protein (TIGR02145 family)
MKIRIFISLSLTLTLLFTDIAIAGNFTDNGNGTVTDSNTGLMWQKENDNTDRTWESAITYCEGLSLGSYTDWRLPNIKELESITDDSRYNPAIDTTYFPNTYSSGYWSSTTFACCATSALGVGFGNGGVANYGPEKSNNNYVRCVRGGATVTDIDGNVYNTVTIGTQVWMKENLKVTKYRNGDAIGTTTGGIPNDSSSKYQWAYDGNESNATIYGRLYTGYAATDTRGICPTGWHVPTDAEWTTLIDYLGGSGVAGGKMKEAGTTHWNSPNTGADNSSGFTGLPGGTRFNDGTFYYMGYLGYWWSATDYDATRTWTSGLYSPNSAVNRDPIDKDRGFSVRCVGD